MIEVNLKGVWLCMKYEIPAILKQGGAIVNNASVAGLKSGAGTLAYTASKHGVVGLTKAVALEFATQGIRVNAISPGAISTPFYGKMGLGEKLSEVAAALQAKIGLKRFGEPAELAKAALYLASDDASYVTGVELAVDGGLTQF